MEGGKNTSNQENYPVHCQMQNLGVEKPFPSTVSPNRTSEPAQGEDGYRVT